MDDKSVSKPGVKGQGDFLYFSVTWKVFQANKRVADRQGIFWLCVYSKNRVKTALCRKCVVDRNQLQ